MKQVFKIPKGCNRVVIEQQDNQIITTFEPEFKEGGILVKKYKPGFSEGMEYIFILDNIDIDGLINYKARYSKKSKSVTIRNDYGIGSIKDCLHLELRYATEFEKQQLLDAIAKNGKQWNAEKKCIEDSKPEFNDGDIIYATCSKIFIVKDFEKGSFHAFLDTNYDDIVLNDFLSPKFGGFKCRIASPDEINKIKQSLYKVGKIWNAEKKCIEDLKPKRWRSEEGCRYYFAMPYKGCLGHCSDAIDYRSGQDNKRYKAGNYFKTEAEANSAGLKMKELLKQINP